TTNSKPYRLSLHDALPIWYEGDLQCHTFHSDGQGSPEQLHATARREGLDFLAVTEHNTLTSHPAYFAGASSQDLIFIPAYEFTRSEEHTSELQSREKLVCR